MTSLDYLALRKRRAERENVILNNFGHHTAFADRVEQIVCELQEVNITVLRVRCRLRAVAHARFFIFYILIQPYGVRNRDWLARRYNIDPWSVTYGVRQVRNNLDLKKRVITIMALLERQLEFELFGPVEVQMGAENEQRASEASRRCDPLLWE